MKKNKIIQTPAVLEGIGHLKDGSLSLRFHTQEMTDEEKLTLMGFFQSFGYILFRANQFNDADIPKDDASDKQKTPSQRLRAVIFVMWKQKGSGIRMEIWRRHDKTLKDRRRRQGGGRKAGESARGGRSRNSSNGSGGHEPAGKGRKDIMKKIALLAILLIAVASNAVQAGEWYEKIKLGGDFRDRYDGIWDETKDYDRHRNRIRARLSLKASITEDFTFTSRFATGINDPASTNRTLTDAFTTKGYWLDLAYFDFHPVKAEGLHIYGGKMKNSFYKPAKNQMVWDGGVNPECIAINFGRDASEKVSYFLVGSWYTVMERKADPDIYMLGAQGGLKIKTSEKTHISFGANYFGYQNLKGSPALFDGKFFGNSSVDDDGTDVFANDYTLVEGFGEFGFKTGKASWTAYGSYVNNTAADSLNTGYIAGLGVKSGKGKGAWKREEGAEPERIHSELSPPEAELVVVESRSHPSERLEAFLGRHKIKSRVKAGSSLKFCLVAEGKADGDRLAIRGGSAGGYVTLCALTFHEVFAAGASYYSVADAAILAQHTHKFEERYLDSLIGPYPEKEDLYRDRSPIYHTDQLSSPVILFQGLEDKVVNPEQSEILAKALSEKGLPYAYLTFEGEQHGFRRSETIESCLEAELYFYSRILGFELPAGVPPVEIHNLD